MRQWKQESLQRGKNRKLDTKEAGKRGSWKRVTMEMEEKRREEAREN